MVNGATVTGIFGKKEDFCELESFSKVNLYDGVTILMLSRMVLIDP